MKNNDKNSWFDSYQKQDSFIVNTYPESVLNDVSSGINCLPIVDLYTKLYHKEVDSASYITRYESLEQPLLHGSVTYYEKMTSGAYWDKSCGYADHVCLTSGATGAISSLFEYMSATESEKSILLLGYQYFLFAVMAKHYGFFYSTLVDKSEKENIPKLWQIRESLYKLKGKYVFLTIPSNPSGEIYSETEMSELLQLVKKTDKILVIDKCLWDDVTFMLRPEYYSLSKLIIEQKAVDNVVIMHSFSKIRSVPGVRFGYLMGKQELIEFTKYYCDRQYCMNNTAYVIPIAIDLFFQTLLVCKDIDIAVLKKRFRQVVLTSMDREGTRQILLAYLRSCESDLESYLQVLYENDRTMRANFQMTKNIFKGQEDIDFTDMKTGFNYCMIYNNAKGYSEKEVVSYISVALNSRIFTQHNFCCTEPRQSIWFRFSCAGDDEQYFKKLEELRNLLQKL